MPAQLLTRGQQLGLTGRDGQRADPDMLLNPDASTHSGQPNPSRGRYSSCRNRGTR